MTQDHRALLGFPPSASWHKVSSLYFWTSQKRKLLANSSAFGAFNIQMFCSYCFSLASHLSNLLCSETSLVLDNLDNSTGRGNTAHGWWLLEIPENDGSSADLVYFYTFTFIHVTGHSLQLILRKRKDEAFQVCQKSMLQLLETKETESCLCGKLSLNTCISSCCCSPAQLWGAMGGLEGSSSLPWHTLNTMIACSVRFLFLPIFLFDCQAEGFIKYIIPKAGCHFFPLWGVTKPTQFLCCRKYSSKTLHLADEIADLSITILSKSLVLSSQSAYP